MSKKLDINIILDQFKSVHGNTYDYSKFEYINTDNKSIIVCKQHGEFEMSHYKHYKRKQGCRECANKKIKYNSLSQLEFLDKCKIKHNSKYDYSKVIYKNSLSNIKIICPAHGEFEQNARTHLNGSGCNECVDYRNIKSIGALLNLLSKDYTYSNIEQEFNSLTSKITVVCDKHNTNSLKSIQKLLHNKSYCNECSKERIIHSGYKLSEWINYCNSKNITTAYLYLLKCYNETESFYKIGITTNKNIKDRYNSNFLMPYNYELLYIKTDTIINVFKQEKELLFINKQGDNRYRPKIKFRGMYETFKTILKWN